jgi:hypothetical protein
MVNGMTSESAQPEAWSKRAILKRAEQKKLVRKRKSISKLVKQIPIMLK